MSYYIIDPMEEGKDVMLAELKHELRYLCIFDTIYLCRFSITRTIDGYEFDNGNNMKVKLVKMGGSYELDIAGAVQVVVDAFTVDVADVKGARGYRYRKDYLSGRYCLADKYIIVDGKWIGVNERFFLDEQKCAHSDIRIHTSVVNMTCIIDVTDDMSIGFDKNGALHLSLSLRDTDDVQALMSYENGSLKM
jgi:hypothetical protein